MITDVLDLVLPSSAFSAASYLSGSTPSLCYRSAANEDGITDVVWMKGLQGYPWDWWRVTDNWIHQLLTENKWSQPNTGKLASPATLGARRLPRYIDYTYPVVSYVPEAAFGTVQEVSGSLITPSMPLPSVTPGGARWQFIVSQPETDYFIFDSPDATGQQYGVPNQQRYSNAICRNTLVGPLPGAAIGDLPAGEDWWAEYERNGAIVNGVLVCKYMERIRHRRGYGRYMWEQFKWNGTAYVPDLNLQGQPYVSQTTTIKPLPATGPVTPVQRVF